MRTRAPSHHSQQACLETCLSCQQKHWCVCVCAVGDQVKNIQVPESDLDIQTMRASGAGGQHVNKTESAVRVRHIPSGLSVRIEDNRSQLMNKVRCMLSCWRLSFTSDAYWH